VIVNTRSHILPQTANRQAPSRAFRWGRIPIGITGFSRVFRPLPACPAGERVLEPIRRQRHSPDPCRLVRQVKLFPSYRDPLRPRYPLDPRRPIRRIRRSSIVSGGGRTVAIEHLHLPDKPAGVGACGSVRLHERILNGAEWHPFRAYDWSRETPQVRSHRPGMAQHQNAGARGEPLLSRDTCRSPRWRVGLVLARFRPSCIQRVRRPR